MNTDFTSYWGQRTAANPLFVHPCASVVLGVVEFREELWDAYQAGVIHAMAVVKQWQEIAAESDGPAALKPHFDQVFGARKVG